jgi:hypothetical protein
MNFSGYYSNDDQAAQQFRQPTSAVSATKWDEQKYLVKRTYTARPRHKCMAMYKKIPYQRRAESTVKMSRDAFDGRPVMRWAMGKPGWGRSTGSRRMWAENDDPPRCTINGIFRLRLPELGVKFLLNKIQFNSHPILRAFPQKLTWRCAISGGIFSSSDSFCNCQAFLRSNASQNIFRTADKNYPLSIAFPFVLGFVSLPGGFRVRLSTFARYISG